jgi:hypothetical protein
MGNVALVQHFAEIYPHLINEPSGKRGPIHQDELTPEIARVLLALGANPDLCYELQGIGHGTALDFVPLCDVELIRVLVGARASVTSEKRRRLIHMVLSLGTQFSGKK